MRLRFFRSTTVATTKTTTAANKVEAAAVRGRNEVTTATPADFDQALKIIDKQSRVTLKDPLVAHKEEVLQVPVQRLDCSFGVVRAEGNPMPLQNVLTQERNRAGGDGGGGAHATIVFAIRRPGCGNCREHGRQLVELATQEMRNRRRIAMVGVVKEIGVADQELDDFYQHYFRQPIYRDQNWKIYKYMGNRKLSLLSLIKGHFKNLARYKKKKIANIPFGGDLYTQGGLLIFDKTGELRYAYEEVFGEELDMAAVRAAIDGCV